MWSIPLNPRGSYMGYLIPPSRPQFSPSLACIRTITAVSQLVPRLQPHPVSGFLLATGKVTFIQHRSVHVTSLQRILQPLLPDRCRALSRLYHVALTLLNLITKLPFLHLVPSQRLPTPTPLSSLFPFPGMPSCSVSGIDLSLFSTHDLVFLL